MSEPAAALADATGVQAHPDAIGRFQRKLCFMYKKDTGRGRAAARKGKKQRKGGVKHRLPAVATRQQRVVFIGETSFKTNLTRQRG